MEVRIMLTNEEETYVKELYAERVKYEQREILDKEMWEKVEIEKKKKDWTKVVEIKREYKILKEAL